MGQQPPELTAEAFAKRIDLPLLWNEQLQATGRPMQVFDRFSRSWSRTSFELNGPASPANGEIARRLPTNYSKSTFSGAAR